MCVHGNSSFAREVNMGQISTVVMHTAMWIDADITWHVSWRECKCRYWSVSHLWPLISPKVHKSNIEVSVMSKLKIRASAMHDSVVCISTGNRCNISSRNIKNDQLVSSPNNGVSINFEILRKQYSLYCGTIRYYKVARESKWAYHSRDGRGLSLRMRIKAVSSS